MNDVNCNMLVDLLQMVLMSALLWKRWMRCLPPSGFACTLLGGLATATVLDAFRFWAPEHALQTILPEPELRSQQAVTVRFILAALMLGNFIYSGLRDLVLFKPSKSKKSNDEDSSSVFARLACVVIYPHCRDAINKKKLAKIKFPVIRRGIRCKRLLDHLVFLLDSRRVVHASEISKKHMFRNKGRILAADPAENVSA
ncbi:uncharacterized protein LOC144108534 [Amblyomma americanum]